MGDTRDEDLAGLSFEDALKRLETIVSRLESGEASLDESITLYAEGDRLRAQCEKRLADAQARIEKILSPRAFVLVATWGRGDRDVHDSRVLVITTDPAIRIREDMLVEVFGRPYTLQGARAQDEWAGAGISAAMEEDYAEWPVLIATGGQAPGGAMMFGRPPR